MTWSKLGLLVPALTVAWLAVAAAEEEAAPQAADRPVAELPADDPAALPSPDTSADAAPAPEPAAASETPLEAEGSEPASAAPQDAADAMSGTPGETAAQPAAESGTPALGAVGYDSEGRQGRVHIVRSGDTLWDISDAYLGTPWVWPSIWRDNGQVENPHRIYPGDRIWITPNEMRKISAEEAAILLSNLPPGSELQPAAAEEIFPSAPAPLQPEPAAAPVERATVHVADRESVGLVTPEQYEASGSIVGRVPERVLLSQEDRVYIGLGEGAVSVGDQLTVFRVRDKVLDPDSGRMLGYHVDFLGWVEVTETHPESSLARIRMSTGEVEIGDRLTPRDPLPATIAIGPRPEDVEGKITFFPHKRVVMAWNDFVYLNRGSVDGLEVGSPLEVIRPGYTTEDPARDEKVHVPDRVIARLVVVRTGEDSSTALVTKAETELKLGDQFRGAPPANEVN